MGRGRRARHRLRRPDRAAARALSPPGARRPPSRPEAEGARPAPHGRVPRRGPRRDRRAHRGRGAGRRGDVLPGARAAGPAPRLQGAGPVAGRGPRRRGGRGHLRPGALRAARAARAGRVRSRPGPHGLQVQAPGPRASSPTACSTCWRSCRWPASCTDRAPCPVGTGLGAGTGAGVAPGTPSSTSSGPAQPLGRAFGHHGSDATTVSARARHPGRRSVA